MGIGEAFVTLLNEKGIPTPLLHTMLAPPRSRMDVLSDEEIRQLVGQSKLAPKYSQPVDSHSAYEILNQKLEVAAASHNGEVEAKRSLEEVKQKSQPKEESFFDNPVVKQVGRTAASVITRSLLGALGLGGSTRRRKSSLW